MKTQCPFCGKHISIGDRLSKYERVRGYLSEHRRCVALYVRQNWLKTQNETSDVNIWADDRFPEIPMFFKRGWIPELPLEIKDLQKEKRGIILRDRSNLPEKSKFANTDEFLSDIAARYSYFENNMTFRLFSVKTINNNLPTFEFCIGDYAGYLDTCEVLGYNLADNIISKGLDRDVLRMSYGNFFDFTKRSAAVRIDTLLILLDDAEPVFYLHNRTCEVFEAPKTLHVVPAGLFQPRNSACRIKDFKFCKNILREFGEELLGKEEFAYDVEGDMDILENSTIREVVHLLENGQGKAYYLGIGIDCFSAKPEILSALVFDRGAIEKTFQKKRGEPLFKNNYEGKYRIEKFSLNEIRRYIQNAQKDNLLPAGQACLELAMQNFEFFQECLSKDEGS